MSYDLNDDGGYYDWMDDDDEDDDVKKVYDDDDDALNDVDDDVMMMMMMMFDVYCHNLEKKTEKKKYDSIIQMNYDDGDKPNKNHRKLNSPVEHLLVPLIVSIVRPKYDVQFRLVFVPKSHQHQICQKQKCFPVRKITINRM